MYSKPVLEVLARVNTILADHDLEPVVLPPLRRCRYCGSYDPDRPEGKRYTGVLPETSRSAYCSEYHRQQYAWPTWDPAGCEQSLGEVEGHSPMACSRTSPSDWERADGARMKIEAHTEDGDWEPWTMDVEWGHRNVAWRVSLGEGLPDGEPDFELDFSGSTPEMKLTLRSAPTHENDRWPDFPVCSRCQPIIPRTDTERIARRETLPGPPVHRRYHAGVKHAAGIVLNVRSERATVERELFAVEAEATRTVAGEELLERDCLMEILSLTRAQIADDSGRDDRQRFGSEDERPVSLDRLKEDGWEPAVDHTGSRPRRPEDEALEVGMKVFLDRLPDTQQDAIRLVFRERYSYRAADAALRLKPSGAQGRIRRAVGTLRKMLVEAVGSTPTENPGG